MKTQLIRMSVFAVVTAAAVYAQNSHTGMANIPFDFIVGSQAMPAGQYTVERGFASSLLTLKSDSGQIQNVITHAVESVDVQTVGKLVFHRYGNEYFLSEAWTPGSNSGRQLEKTSHERELARRAIQTGTTVVAAVK